MFKFIFQNVVTIFMPSILKIKILNLIGHSISRKSKIGPVILGRSTKLSLHEGAFIGGFNLLSCHSLELKQDSFIRRFNTFQGEFTVKLNKQASIGNFNRFVNSSFELEKSKPELKLGVSSNLTSKHYFDMTESIIIGRNTVIGGRGSQFWTHGFQHFNKGTSRFRVDGAIQIGDGVYIGSRVLFNPGVIVSDSVSLGSGAIVSKDLLHPGLYVSQQLRCLEVSEESFLKKYKPHTYDSIKFSIYKKE